MLCKGERGTVGLMWRNRGNRVYESGVRPGEAPVSDEGEVP